MPCPKLPKDIWSHIRSFSGDTGYEPTPTAKLIGDYVLVRDDSAGTWQFPRFGRDGYASTVVLALSPAFFLKREPWIGLWEHSSYIRILHLDYDGPGGYLRRASQHSE